MDGNNAGHPKVNMKITIMKNNEYGFPKYGTEGSSGFDLNACITETIGLEPSKIMIISAGIKVDIPRGYEIQIRSRSGLASKGLIVLNAPGTIDSDYRGEIKVILQNVGDKTYMIEPGTRIAQAVLCPVYQAVLVHLTNEAEFSESRRGENGLGSTGTN